MARDTDTTRKVLKYLREHTGQELHFRDVADGAGVTERQVMTSVSYLARNHGARIDKPRKGWYIYRGDAAHGATTLVRMKGKCTVVAMLEDGRLLIECEGKLYTATELQLS